ncbi:hypothetical protein CPC08DRAFT_766250 [Agrocybe pediades]|nr:hypothetical protein CPC08DRAFT_766250 [Agrocybe pediades]
MRRRRWKQEGRDKEGNRTRRTSSSVRSTTHDGRPPLCATSPGATHAHPFTPTLERHVTRRNRAATSHVTQPPMQRVNADMRPPSPLSAPLLPHHPSRASQNAPPRPTSTQPRTSNPATSLSLPQLHYIGGNFNIHSREWDPEVTHHRGDVINLLELAADLDLEWTQPSNPGPTFISHNLDLRPSVIDLVFHRIAESASDCTFRDPVRQGPSDHILIFTIVKLDDKIEPVTRRTIPRYSEAEQAMKTKLPQKVADIQASDLETREDIEQVAQALADAYAEAWLAHSKVSQITKHSQPWWN